MALALLLPSSSTAQTVWSGFTFSFTKLNDHDPTQPENQDRITDNVWITRSVQQGIFNIAVEDFYTSSSPADTRWATELTSPGENIAATNWQDLTFTNWANAYGGTFNLATNIVSFPAVVQLITDNVYLDLQFTGWTSSAGGGGFSYVRAEGQLPPTTTGDYNGNGVVDAADYVIWRKTLNEPAVPAGSGADGNANGTIDSGDYTFWAARFANTVPGAGAGALNAAVPEPAAAVLVLIGIGCVPAFLRTRPRS
jgi:hypothetical protein